MGSCWQMKVRDGWIEHTIPTTEPQPPWLCTSRHPGLQKHLINIVFAKLMAFLAQVHWLHSLYSLENTAEILCIPCRRMAQRPADDLPSPCASLSLQSTAGADTACLAQPQPAWPSHLPSRCLKMDKGNPESISPALQIHEST